MVTVLVATFFILSIYPILQLGLLTSGFILILFGGTFFFWGFSVFTSYHFPWLFMFMAIPLPSRVVSEIIRFFQYGSAEVVNIMLQICRLDFIRDNLTFHLSSISIVIAEECSGIRSSTVLVIVAAISAHLNCKTIVGKIILLFFVIPLTLIKNGIRITTLTFLAEKFDTKWLTDSHLHHDGGIVFFVIALLLLFGIMSLIRKLEQFFINRKKTRNPQ